MKSLDLNYFLFYNILVDNFESEELLCFLTFYNA